MIVSESNPTLSRTSNSYAFRFIVLRSSKVAWARRFWDANCLEISYICVYTLPGSEDNASVYDFWAVSSLYFSNTPDTIRLSSSPVCSYKFWAATFWFSLYASVRLSTLPFNPIIASPCLVYPWINSGISWAMIWVIWL